jgi:phage FluMu protein Com
MRAIVGLVAVFLVGCGGPSGPVSLPARCPRCEHVFDLKADPALQWERRTECPRCGTAYLNVVYYRRYQEFRKD